jgi:hypothetical protein
VQTWRTSAERQRSISIAWRISRSGPKVNQCARDMETLLCRQADSNHITNSMRGPGELVLDHRLSSLPLSCGHGGSFVYYRKSRYCHENRCDHGDNVR